MCSRDFELTYYSRLYSPSQWKSLGRDKLSSRYTVALLGLGEKHHFFMLRALEGILLKILSLLSVWYSVQFSMYLLSASYDLGIISGARERKTSNIQLKLYTKSHKDVLYFIYVLRWQFLADIVEVAKWHRENAKPHMHACFFLEASLLLCSHLKSFSEAQQKMSVSDESDSSVLSGYYQAMVAWSCLLTCWFTDECLIPQTCNNCNGRKRVNFLLPSVL